MVVLNELRERKNIMNKSLYIVRNELKLVFIKLYLNDNENERASFKNIPISLLNQFKSAFGSDYRIRYRGPRKNADLGISKQGFKYIRDNDNKQSTCLKQDAVKFSAYRVK